MNDALSSDEYNAMMAGQKRPKYGNRKVEEDGHTFDSMAELRHYRDLRLRLAAGDITDLELQPVFPLIVNGVKVAQYRADFAYTDVATGERVIVDVKSDPTKTPVYRLKKKILKAQYGIDIIEVEA